MDKYMDFVIVTALEEEREAVLALLPKPERVNPDGRDIRVYFRADLPTQFPDGSASSYRLAVMCLLGMGLVEAATAVSDAIRRWTPRYVLLVGIAGGSAKAGIALGDVIVADQIVDYEQQKVTDAGAQVRYQVHRADPTLLAVVQNHRSDAWSQRVAERRPQKGVPQRSVGGIATGNKVIAKRALLDEIRGDWPKLVGVEMEAGGAASACFQSPAKPGFFMIRGVSDLADRRKSSAVTRVWRQYACDVAASYAVDLLQSGPVLPAKSQRHPADDESRQAESERPLIEILSEKSFELDETALINHVFARLKDGALPSDLKVRIEAPKFRALVSRVHQQALKEKNPDICALQHSAVDFANNRFSRGGDLAATILIEISKRSGMRDAVGCCARFISLSMIRLLDSTARYQSGDTHEALFTDVLDALNNSDSSYRGALWLAYQKSPLIALSIAAHPNSTNVKVFVPFAEVENTGFGKLIGDIWDRASYLRASLWVDFAIPQMASNCALGNKSYFSWSAEESFYTPTMDLVIEGKNRFAKLSEGEILLPDDISANRA